MRWVICDGRNTSDALTTEQVATLGQQGKLWSKASIREEPGGQWVQLPDSPFRQFVKQPTDWIRLLAIWWLTGIGIAAFYGLLERLQ